MTTRDEILRAVRLHAAKNGGVPVGKRAFEAMSGIGQSAWYGKYWAKWNDLLADAGFGPNAWNAKIYDRVILTRRLAELILELGHYPTIAERNLMHRTDPSVPFDSAFAKHIGTRQEQLLAVVEFAVANSEFRAVYDICAPLLIEEQAAETHAATEAAPSSPGRVYLVQSGALYKIGKSDNPDRRYRQVQLAVPEPVVEIHVLGTDDPAGIELYWHRRFGSKRRAGEWFELDAADVAAFKRRGSFM